MPHDDRIMELTVTSKRKYESTKYGTTRTTSMREGGYLFRSPVERGLPSAILDVEQILSEDRE